MPEKLLPSRRLKEQMNRSPEKRSRIRYESGLREFAAELSSKDSFSLEISHGQRKEFVDVLDSKKVLSDRRVIIWGGHPDDESIAGGLAAELSDRGIGVTIIVGTKGDARPVAGYTQEMLAQQRRREGRDSAQVLGAGAFATLGFDDTRLERDKEQATESLTQLIRIIDPHVIITLNPHDEHFDHRILKDIAYNAAFRARNASPLDAVSGIDVLTSPMPEIDCADTQSLLDLDNKLVVPERVIRISQGAFDRKIMSALAHPTQEHEDDLRQFYDQTDGVTRAPDLLWPRLEGYSRVGGFCPKEDILAQWLGEENVFVLKEKPSEVVVYRSGEKEKGLVMAL